MAKKFKEENYNNSSIKLPPNFVGEGYSWNNWVSPAWGGRWKNGGILSNDSIPEEYITKFDSLSNELRDLQEIETNRFRNKYKNIPVEEILNTSQQNKKFKNSELSSVADSLINKYGDLSIEPSPEYISKLNQYNNFLSSLNVSIPTIGEKEDDFKNFGWRAMNYKYTHPSNIPAYKALEKKSNGGELKPGDVGFSFPRTKGIPSEGKYAKKTLSSALNGKEMQYYQEGLDFQPKTISEFGSELKKLDDLVNFTNYNTRQAEEGISMTPIKPIQVNQLTNSFSPQKQGLMPMSVPQAGNNFMSSIGGVGGAANIAGDLIQGVQQLGVEKKKRKSAQQWSKISDVMLKAAETQPKEEQRKYLRPEDNINTGSEFFPVYGVGTNVLKDGGDIYPTNKFLQPNSPKLPNATRIPFKDTGSSEVAQSIGGENGEPAYLIPSFKHGKFLDNPLSEYKNTGEYLGGPFKTWQEADKWETEVRHPYVEKGQAIPSPLKWWGEGYKNGGEIQNTYAPNTLYDDLEYFPIAESGMTVDPWSMGADVISRGITGFTGQNAGGDIGGTLGQAAGTAIGGPIGGAIGKVGGKLIGSLIDTNPKKTKQAQEHFDKNMQRIGVGNQIQQQYTSYMEDGGDLKYISHDWLPETFTSLDNYRSGGNLKADYIPPRAEGIKPYAMGGDIQTHWGGAAEPISYNPFLPDEGETIMFRGQSHEESDGQGRTGIGVTYGNNPVEVENNEPAIKLSDGGNESNLVVFGNLQIPKGMLNDKNADGRKFKSYIADLSKKENNVNKLMDNSVTKLDDLDVKTSFDKLKFSSLKANMLGANMKLKEIANKKQNAAALQSAINDTAEEHGLIADDLAKGKIKTAKYGTMLNKADGGDSLEKISQEDYTTLMNMYNKAKQQGRGKDVEEFQKAFSNLLPNRAKSILQKYPVTNYGKEQGLAPTDLASNYDAIFGQRTEQYLPQIQDALNNKITPIAGRLMSSPIDTNKLATSYPTQQSTNNTPELSKKGNFKLDDLMGIANGLIPYLRPSNAEGLDPRQLAGEMYALTHNQVEPVYAQTIQPDLSTPYDISLQDMMPRFEAAKRSAQNNPAALAQIEAQEQEYRNKVLGEQFRQNQEEKASVYEGNRNLINQAKLQNLNILSQQQDKQALAKSNTKAVTQKALESISDKYLKNKLENKTLGIYENLYNYRYDDRGRAINMNPLAQFNIPTVATSDPEIMPITDYEKAKATVKAYDEQENKRVKAQSRNILPKKTGNGDIVKAFKGY